MLTCFEAGAFPPVNDNFAGRIVLPGTYNATGLGNNIDATLEAGEPNPFANAGASAWWSWTPSTSGYVDIDTFASDFDTVVYVYTGNTLGALTLVGGDDDSDGTFQSRVTFYATASITYQIAVLGFQDPSTPLETGTIELNLNPGASPPVEDDFTGGRTLNPTFNVTFNGSSARAGIEPLEPDSYEYGGASVWFYWTAPSNGPLEINTNGSAFDTILYVYTGSTLGGLTEVARDDDGGNGLQSRVASLTVTVGVTYRIAVHGVYGENGSYTLQLKNAVVSPPANDHFANRASLPGTLPANASGSNIAATLEPPSEPDSLGVGGASVWWSWMAPSSGFVEISTAGSNFDTVLYVYTGSTLGGLTEVESNDDEAPGVLTSLVNFQAVGGTNYKIAVHGLYGDTGTVNLDISAGTTPPGNDAFGNKIPLASIPTVSTSGSNVAATLEPSEPNPIAEGDASVWWSWTAPSSGWFQVDTFGIGAAVDTILYVATGDTLGSLVTVGVDDDSAGTSQSRVMLDATSGVNYKIAVLGFQGDGGPINLNIVPAAAPPPGNDKFANRTNLVSAYPVATAGNSTGAGIEVSEPDPLRDGGASVWWRWTSPVTGWVEVNTLGSAIDTILYVFTGSTLGGLTSVAIGDDDAGTSQSSATFMATTGVTYQIAVHGDHGQEGPVSLAINPGVAPPANNDFVNRTSLGTADSVTTFGSNVAAGIEINEPDPLGGGGASVWWSWSPATTGWFKVRTFGSSFDTLLYAFSGTNLNNLVPRGMGDSANGTAQSEIVIFAMSGESYQIAVHGDLGETGSITLGIVPGSAPTPNDEFADRIALASALPVTTAGSNAGAGIEPGDPDTITGGASVWWSWQAPSTGWVEVNTLGSTFDTILYVHTGTALSQLALVGLGDNTDNTTQSSVTFFATSGVTYQIAVDGHRGLTGSISLEIRTGSQPPANDLFAGPESLGGGTSASTTGSNVASGIEPGEPDPLENGGASVWFAWTAPSSSWFRVETFGSSFDTVLYVFTGTTLETLTPVAANDDAGGTTRSRVDFFATLGVTYKIALHGNDGQTGAYNLVLGTGVPAPANDNFANAIVLTGLPFPVATAGSNIGASLELSEPTQIGGGASVWYEWTPTATDWYRIDTIGSVGLDTVLYVFTGASLPTLQLIKANDDSTGNDSMVNFQANSGVTYKIAVHGDLAETGNFMLNIGLGVAPPVNDDFANRLGLPSLFTTATAGSNISATIEAGEPIPLGEGGASVWWEWTAPSNGWVRFDTAGSSFDTILHAFTGTTVSSLTLVAAGNDAGGSEKARINFFASSGVIYKISVHGDAGDNGSIALAVSPGSPSPINDDFAASESLAGTTATATGSNADATLESGEPKPLGSGGASVWWSWTAPYSGFARIDTLGSYVGTPLTGLDTVLYVFTGSAVGSLTAVAANDDGDGTRQSVVNFEVNSGTIYRIAVHGDHGVTGTVKVNLGPGVAPPANDNFGSRIKIEPDGVFKSVFGNNVGASLEFLKNEPLPLGEGGKSVWWKWKKKDSNGLVQINTFGSTFDTILYVFTGGAVDNLVPIGSSDDAAGTTQSQVNFLAIKDKEYVIAVHGDMGATGNIVLTTAAGVPPPANDNFANRIDLGVTHSASTAGSNVGATREIDEMTSISGAARSVWWRWTASATEKVRVTTLGSNFDTVLFVYTGSALSNLIQIAADDDSSGTFQSRLVINATAGTTYHVAVHGSGGDTGAIALNIEALTAYEQWLADFPSLTGADRLRTADPDGDHLNNLTELVFGLNPTIDSRSAGMDPNAGNIPEFVRTPTGLELYYTLSSFNMNRGAGLPIEVVGGTTRDFADFTEFAPTPRGGDDYKVSTVIDPPDPDPLHPSRQKYLTILVKDPNPPLTP